MALRNSGHLGRIGDWAEMAAREGKVSLLFVNTSGGGILVAPHGGTEAQALRQPDRRGSAYLRRPADHPRHLHLHHRRGEGPRRVEQGRTRPRGMPARQPRAADHRSPGFLCVASGCDLTPGWAQGLCAQRDRRGARRCAFGRVVQQARNEGRLKQLAGNPHRPAEAPRGPTSTRTWPTSPRG